MFIVFISVYCVLRLHTQREQIATKEMDLLLLTGKIERMELNSFKSNIILEKMQCERIQKQ